MAPLFLMRVRLALTLTVFGCGLASAQNAATRIWTLEECLGHAFEHNLQLKQTELGLRRGEVATLAAKGAFLPNLNAPPSLA